MDATSGSLGTIEINASLNIIHIAVTTTHIMLGPHFRRGDEATHLQAGSLPTATEDIYVGNVLFDWGR